MLADDAEVIDSGSPKFIPEETYTDHRGRRRVLETTKIPFRESGSGRPAILGVAVDITERKALAERLSDHLGLLEELFFDRGALPLDTLGRILDAHTDLLLVVDPELRVAEANRALRDALGRSREALIGASLEQIFPRADHAAFYAALERLQEAGRIQDAPCELTLRDGSRIRAECRGVRRDGEGGAPAQLRLLLRDLARHSRLSTALLRTEQLVTTGRLAAGVAHEINNPLQALLLHLDSVEAELPADFAESESLLAIKQGIGRIQQVVNDLLDLHRIGSRRRERVDLNAIVREATRLATSQFQERGIAQYVHLADDLPPVSGVSQHLYQIVLNLLLNGAEAIGRRGRLDVTTRAEGGSVVVQIRDSGAGMAPEEMAEIFAPTYTRRQGRGTGLGLFVTYNLIKENEGSIEVESRPGEGSLFRVRFPRLAGATN
jgi:PAS domain S-box-containing protein